MAAARLSYIDAIIAEPYTRRPWMGLGNWARAAHVVPNHPRVVPEDLDVPSEPPKETAAKTIKKGNPTAEGQPDDGRSEWHLYRETRDTWRKERFGRAFPGAAYRHSLAEETDALRQVAKAIAAGMKAGRIKQPHPCFVNLIRLDHEGLLEAYILFTRADQGISADFESYRQKHRGELRRYLRKYVAPVGDGENDADLVI